MDGFNNKYPYTDFHEMNLDWFLKEFKKVYDHVDDLQNNVDDFEERTTNRVNTLDRTVRDFIAFVNNYFENLDVQEEINNKLNAWLADGTIAEVLGESLYYTVPEFFGAVGDGVTDDTNAIISAFNYCKTHNTALKSYNKHYLTTNLCILDFGSDSFEIEMHGTFDYLEFIGNPSVRLNNKIYINKVTTLKIVNIKNMTFDAGYINDMHLIADTLIDASGSCAYNNFTGDEFESITIENINPDGSGWINENFFTGIRCKNLTITSGSYHHNNNRFYDMTLEGGIITLHNCQGNYIRCRGEGGYTLNDDNTAFNNIIERCYSAKSFGPVRGNYVGSISKQGNIETYDSIKYLNFQQIKSFNINNVYNDNNDYAAGTFRMLNNSKIAIFDAPADNTYFIVCNADKAMMRGYITLYDDQGNIIDIDNQEELFMGIGYSKNAAGTWRNTSDRDHVSIALLSQSDPTKRIHLEIICTAADEDINFIDLQKGCVGIDKSVMKSDYDKMSYASIPTNTGAPLGTIVQDSTGTTKGWVLMSGGWTAL